MKRVLPLLCVALAGCSGEEAKEVVKAVEEPPAVELAGKAVRSDAIAMSWDGVSVHVGDTWEAAQKLFPEPRTSYRLRSLPERFGHDFSAHGWETNEGRGFGAITYKDLVVAAVYHAEDVEADYAQKLLASQRDRTGALPMHEVQNGKLTWNYWEDGSQRLMVLFDKGQKGTDATVLMGDAKVLDALGATKPADRNAATAPFISSPLPKSGSDFP